MPKYSTGGTSSSSSGTTCELCGTESSSLSDATVAGAQLLVCDSCAPHDDAGGTQEPSSRETAERTREVVGKATNGSATMWDGDTSHWEEHGTGYDTDQLPYLVAGYGEDVKEARVDAGLTVDEVARELGVDELTVLAVERGVATKENVPGSVVRGLEDFLDVTLIDA